MKAPGWPSAVVAVAFIAFIGLALFLAIDKDKFLEVWAGVGPIVGVVTGAIPSYFFAGAAQKTAEQAQETVSHLRETADVNQERLRTVLEVAPENVVEQAKQKAPAAWEDVVAAR